MSREIVAGDSFCVWLFVVLFLFCFVFSEKIRLDILCESSRHVIYMQFQALFSLNNDRKKKIKMSASVVISTLTFIQQVTNWWYFSYFSQNSRFDILCNLSHLHEMQNLFSVKNKKNTPVCLLNKIFPRVLSILASLIYNFLFYVFFFFFCCLVCNQSSS